MDAAQLERSRADWLHTQEAYTKLGNKVHAFVSGSGTICGWDAAQDFDVLVLVRDLEDFNSFLYERNWDNCFADWESKTNKDPGQLAASDGYIVELDKGARFSAWRKRDVNIIVTDDTVLHLRSIAATLVAQYTYQHQPNHGNMHLKQDRISLFRAIKFGENYEGELP